jgi:hypothetical protein
MNDEASVLSGKLATLFLGVAADKEKAAADKELAAIEAANRPKIVEVPEYVVWFC